MAAATIAITNKVPVLADALTRAKSLKLIAVAATGTASGGLPLPVVVGGVTAFFALAPTIGSRGAHWLLARAHTMRGSEGPLAVAIAIALVFAAIAAQVGIAAITGAYLAGLLINREDLYGDLTEKVKVLALSGAMSSAMTCIGFLALAPATMPNPIGPQPATTTVSLPAVP